MGDLKLKAASGGDLILQEDGGTAALTIDTSGDTTVSGDLNPASGPANFVGMIAPFGKSSGTIDGWLYCDGSAVSRSTYSVLFGIISTNWGVGDGSSTFNIPDLRGAFLRGTGSNGTHNMADGNDFAGPSVGSFENDQFQNHGHQIRRAAATSDDVPLGLVAIAGGTDYSGWTKDSGSGSNAPSKISAYNATTNSAGTPRAGDETRPFNAGIRFYIKY
jgi:microcystin-dependent protein